MDQRTRVQPVGQPPVTPVWPPGQLPHHDALPTGAPHTNHSGAAPVTQPNSTPQYPNSNASYFSHSPQSPFFQTSYITLSLPQIHITMPYQWQQPLSGPIVPPAAIGRPQGCFCNCHHATSIRTFAEKGVQSRTPRLMEQTGGYPLNKHRFDRNSPDPRPRRNSRIRLSRTKSCQRQRHDVQPRRRFGLYGSEYPKAHGLDRLVRQLKESWANPQLSTVLPFASLRKMIYPAIEEWEPMLFYDLGRTKVLPSKSQQPRASLLGDGPLSKL